MYDKLKTFILIYVIVNFNGDLQGVSLEIPNQKQYDCDQQL